MHKELFLGELIHTSPEVLETPNLHASIAETCLIFL